MLGKRKLNTEVARYGLALYEPTRAEAQRTRTMPRAYGRRTGGRGAYKSTFRRYKVGGRRSFASAVNIAIDKRIESKWKCFDLAQADLNTNPVTQEFTSINQGTTELTRIGNQVRPTYCEWKLLFEAEATTAAGTSFVRVIVAQARAGTVAGVTKITTPGECLDYDDYNVFYDNIVRLTPANNLTAGGDVPCSALVQGSLVLKGLSGFKRVAQYDGSGAATAGGGLFLYIVSDNTLADLKDGYCMIKYKDG